MKENYDWGKHPKIAEQVRPPTSQILIDNETWRDGMQGSQVVKHPSTEQKASYLKAAESNRYSDHFDIGFPAAGAQQSDEIVTLINFSREEELELTFSAAGRGAAEGDTRAIIEVAQRTGESVEADLFFDASSLRTEAEGWDKKEKLKQLKENIELVKRHGLPVMFVPERSSDTAPEDLFEVCQMAADAGADRIGIADTRGILTPYSAQALFRSILQNVGNKYPEMKFDFHGHNDFEMGLANCLVAANEGIERLHATSRGIGERSGNVPLEQLIVILNLHGFKDVETSKIQEFAHLAADILSVPIRSHEAIIGQESTTTASGVHANAYGKDTTNQIYLPIPPEKIGLKTHVRIGPMSGLSNVYAYCIEIGLSGITEEQAILILNHAKSNGGLLSAEDVKGLLNPNYTDEIMDKISSGSNGSKKASDRVAV